MTPTRTLAAALLCGAAFSVLPTAAFAECTVEGMPMANGSNPESGQTVICADNLDNEGVINREADNVTVEIQAPAGGISVTGQGGVALGNGATVRVAGGSNRPINTSGDDAIGIEVGNGALIEVGGQVTTSGGNSDAIRTGDMAEVNVTGTVRTGGGNSAGISVGAMSTVNIMTDARVATGNSNSSAILLRGDGSTVNIMRDALVTTSSGMSNPILVQGDNGTVNVSGDVRSSSGNATAILLEGDNGVVTVRDGGFVTAQSSGSNGIESTGTGAQITVEEGGEVRISSGNSAAIVSGDMATVTLSGLVSASSSQSQGIILGDMSELTITGTGVIETSSSGSQAVLVAEDATMATITVEEGGMIDAVGAQAIVDRGMTSTMVTINGTVFGGSSEPTLDMGAGDDTVIINGTVEASSASPAVDMGAGMDTLTINSSTTLMGPDVLADLGDGMDTLNLNSGQEFDSSQFRGAETVNVNENTMEGDPNMGMGTTYTVSDMQGMQTVNVGANSSASVEEGGMVGTLNSSGEGSSADVNEGGMAGSVNASDGGSANVNEGGQAGDVNSSGEGSEANVNEGGMANNVNASEGGSANVNEGGMAGNVNSSGEGSQANVNSGGSAMNVNASDGGSANINEGGRSMNTTSGNGGTVNVNSGGDAGRVQSDTGGSVTVRNGGSANVDSRSGNGGSLTFESGSNANVEGGATARDQSMQIRGADFQEGSGVTVTNSRFFEGSAAGDTMSVRVRRDAFSGELALEGATNANTLAAARGLDGLVSGQVDGQALDAIGNILFIGQGEATDTFAAIAQEGSVQLSAAAPFVARQFNDMLRAGTNPLTGDDAFASRRSPVQVAGPYSGANFRDDNNTGVWVATTFGDVDVDGDNQTAFDAQSVGYAAGFEGRVQKGGFDEAALGVAVGYTYTDINSESLADGDAESWSVGVYGGATKGSLRTDLALSYTNSDLDDDASVEGTLIEGRSTQADAFAGRVEMAWDLAGDANTGFTASPLVRASTTLVSFDDFAAAGPVGTQLNDGEFEQAVLGAGARIGFVSRDDRSAVKATVEAAYERVLGDRDVAFAAGIGGTSNAFDVVQTAADRDRVHLGGTVGVELMDSLDVGLRYDGRFGSDVTDHGASARLTYRF